ncbi:MAG: (2Fe-2S)-binding protein [Xanthomonadales bacterium]|nr:(2Fe-2S)-binding protein [Gammaproteobacteria bacterium]MBT8074670.1 (2Fe-2S)-binding protein [Gammaproteobacteria bacterium]NNK05523.1 (2Fe-2S)-binding protein [Xanthomonadales bacterium]NNK98951.1 (2Fe-2S)-binding protein [Xanthomonadales bacterium]
MYVCVCNAVTDSHIRNAVDDGVRTFKQLSRTTGCGSTCGSCRETAIEVLVQSLTEKRETTGLLTVMQIA